MSLVLGLGLEHSCPWPREGLSSERLSLALALASDFFCVLGLGLGLEPCVLDSISDNGPGNGVTYLTHKKRYLVLHEPPSIKSCTYIEQFVKKLLHLNYPNHTQSVEGAVKMTTTASGRIAGSKRQIGKAPCTIAGRKKQWIGKKILRHKKNCSC